MLEIIKSSWTTFWRQFFLTFYDIKHELITIYWNNLAKVEQTHIFRLFWRSFCKNSIYDVDVYIVFYDHISLAWWQHYMKNGLSYILFHSLN